MTPINERAARFLLAAALHDASNALASDLTRYFDDDSASDDDMDYWPAAGSISSRLTQYTEEILVSWDDDADYHTCLDIINELAADTDDFVQDCSTSDFWTPLFLFMPDDFIDDTEDHERRRATKSDEYNRLADLMLANEINEREQLQTMINSYFITPPDHSKATLLKLINADADKIIQASRDAHEALRLQLIVLPGEYAHGSTNPR